MTGWDGVQSARALAALLFASTDGVIELRALGGLSRTGVSAGYFDALDAFVRAANSLDGNATGIYFTLNPVQPALLARACNRVVPGLKTTTGDKDITRRRLLLVDVDAVRPSGISATDAERDAAFELAHEIGAFLEAQGFPAPAKADSGNGAHFLYRIDLPSEDGGLVESFLRALAFRFDTSRVKVDQSVHDSARICKLYGTLARKGDSTADRPHRRSRLFSVPEDFQVVPIELLRAVAALVPQEPRASGTGARRIDVERLLAAKGIEIAKSGPWNGGNRWVLEVCPFNSEHTNRSAYVVQLASGALGAGCLHNSCGGKSWHDLRDILEPGSRDRQSGFVGSGGDPSGACGDYWPDPEPLPNELPPVQAFDLDCLPEVLRPYITDIAERMQCPPEYPAVAAMVAFAGVVGRKVGIRPKRHDDWLVVPNIWGCVIGRPGLLKTPAIMEPLRGIKRLELGAKKSFDAKAAEFTANEVVEKQRRKLAESEIREALKAEDATTLDAAKKLLPEKGIAPTRRRYLVNDSTVEKLGELLNENPNGVVVYRDELMGLLTSLDKEGQEGARSFYLEAWNGDGRYTYDRIGRGTIDIEAVTVSIIGAIQPGPLRSYLHHAINQTNQDDGLIQRFQLAVWPDVKGKWKNVDRCPNAHARAAFNAALDYLNTLDVIGVGAKLDLRDDDSIPFLQFCDAAQLKFDAWREQLGPRLRSGEDHAAIESHLAKYRSLVPSLALLIHLADRDVGAVSEAALDKALRWAGYLESHARRIYSVATNFDVAAAKAIAKKILSAAIQDGFTLRDVYRHNWASLANKEDVQRGVDVLVDLAWVRQMRGPARSESREEGGAPRTTFRVNPAVLQKVTAKTDRTGAAEDVSVLSAATGAADTDPSPPEPSPSHASDHSDPPDKTDKTTDDEVVSVPAGARDAWSARRPARANSGDAASDAPISPNCRNCASPNWWQRLGGGPWICARCTPPMDGIEIVVWSSGGGTQ